MSKTVKRLTGVVLAVTAAKLASDWWGKSETITPKYRENEWSPKAPDPAK